MGVYKRGGVWWIRFTWQGREIRQSAKTKVRAVAEKFERQSREELGHIARGGRPRRLFDDAMLDFIDQHAATLKPSAARRYEVSARVLTPHFEGLYLDKIGKEALSTFERKRRREGRSPSSIRRDLACLSSMFSFEIESDRFDGNPVLPYLKMRRKRGLREAPARTRYLTHEEERALLEACKAYMRPIVEVAIDTGLRLDEQLSLEWSQVNLTRCEITLTKTKTDNPRVVPLLERSARILAHHPRHIHSTYVFHKSDGSRYHKLTRGLAGAVSRAKIAHVKWHDLRRTCGCRLLQDEGLSLAHVSKWLGHKSVTVTERSYAFLEVQHLHEAIRATHERN